MDFDIWRSPDLCAAPDDSARLTITWLTRVQGVFWAALGSLSVLNLNSRDLDCLRVEAFRRPFATPSQDHLREQAFSEAGLPPERCLRSGV